MNLKISENFYNNLVQILVQKVIQQQKKPVTRGLCLISFDADCEHSNCFNELQSTIIYRI